MQTLIDRTTPIVSTSYESPRNGSLMDESGPITVTLGSGKEVLAKFYKEDLAPITCANRTQAEKIAHRTGKGWAAWQSPVSRRFFVVRQ